MDTKKKAKLKGTRGRHAAGAHANTESAAAPSHGPRVTEDADIFQEQPDSADVDTASVPDVAASRTDSLPVYDPYVPMANAPADAAPFSPAIADEPEKQGKALKVVGIVLASILGLILVAYLAGAVVFMDRFFPNTTMGEFDLSLKTVDEAKTILSQGIEDYEVAVSGQGLSFVLSSTDAGLTLDSEAIVSAALDDMKPWMWPFELQREHDETARLAASYNDSGLAEAVGERVAAFNESATQPVNATVAYNTTTGTYQVVPEEIGTALDPEAVLAVVDEAILAMNPTAEISAKALLKPPVLSTEPSLKQAADSANTMLTANITLMMGPSEAAVVGPDQISNWIVFGEDLSTSLDEGLMTAWVDELAASFNTIGTTRTYTRPDGKVITVSGGTYGWAVDGTALLNLVKEGVAAGQKGPVDIPVSQSAGIYSGLGERDWGNSYVDIDLAEQYARYYDDAGAIIWESAIVTGKPDGIHDTPAGVYMLNSKASPSKLIGYENGKKIYETDVTYWMPFIGNAIGFHDATWQSAFGGSRYADGFGSHGCVNLPYSAAQALYGMIYPGVPVISHW